MYEWAARLALRGRWVTVGLTLCVLAGTWGLYDLLKQDFLPDMDEGAFVIDYQMPPENPLAIKLMNR